MTNVQFHSYYFVNLRALNQLGQSDHSKVPDNNHRIWKLKILLKIKIFLWFLRRGVILTKDNLVNRNW
jgi:hypothetical protein